jgi:hypothetical protein
MQHCNIFSYNCLLVPAILQIPPLFPVTRYTFCIAPLPKCDGDPMSAHAQMAECGRNLMILMIFLIVMRIITIMLNGIFCQEAV